VNKTNLKPRIAAAMANTDMWDFPAVIKFRVALAALHAYDIGESNPVPASGL